MPLDNTTVPVPSPTEAFVDRNRYLMPRWYTVIKRLFESLRTTMNAMDSVTETVDQVRGTWTLAINDNNRVTGYLKLDGSAVATEFSVLADKFIIVHPSVDGTTLQAFIAGMVNGVSTVGINGNLIVDDTILARSIAADTLSAITANLGTITAGKLQSADGKVVLDLDNKIFRMSNS